MADDVKSEIIAKLNQAVDIVAGLKSKDLRAILGDGSARLGARNGCDLDCSCRSAMCGCHNVVSGFQERTPTFPEFLKMREERLAELQRQMDELALPKGIE